jgi:SAM-dependent methyltransferase
MSLACGALMCWVRYIGGGLAGDRFEQKYLAEAVPAGSVVVDAGGGEGKLANHVEPSARLVIVLDREETCRDGADNSLYKGSLHKLSHNRRSARVIPIMGDVTRNPLATASVDAIVSSQVLEHLPSTGKRAFFEECARALQPGGALAISTPSEEFYAADPLRISKLARRLLPERLIARLPNLLRGPWLEQSLEEWEKAVGHFGHGCRVEELITLGQQCELEHVDTRYTYTPLSFYWFELLCTFPGLAMLAAPAATLAMAIEWLLPFRGGANLMIRFRRAGE